MIWFNTCEQSEQSDQSDQPQSLRCWQKAKTRFFRGELIVNNTLQLLYQRNATLVIISIDRTENWAATKSGKTRFAKEESLERNRCSLGKRSRQAPSEERSFISWLSLPTKVSNFCVKETPTWAAFLSQLDRHMSKYQAGREKYYPERERGEIFFRIKTRERRQREGISLGNTKIILFAK